MAEALLGLGGNVGEVRAALDRAVTLMCDGEVVRLVARSSDYLTPPWGITDQPPFVNLCLVVETGLSPHALLDRVLRVERVRGRDRRQERRWGPRPVDIDILAYDDLTMDEGGLTLPHPRLLDRAFVLVPLAEIAPDWKINGIKVSDALAQVDTTGIVRLDPPAASGE
jgi:2-amino-4-hydroxy-6-hydroxymethyldihydropteridine diphosphokinase